MLTRASNKENTQGTVRKSKLPVPAGMSVKKGVKRPQSGPEDMTDIQRSPTKQRRQPLIDSKDQTKTTTARPVSKAKRVISKGKPSNTLVGPARQSSQKVTRETKDARVSRVPPAIDTADTSTLLDQKGIEFETDASSLQSILENTGIERPRPTATKAPTPRHTLAGTSVSSHSSMFGKSQGVEKPNFRRWCDEFLSRQSMHQSKAKRHCPSTRDSHQGSAYSFDASKPSDTDFCSKYNVSRTPAFSSKTEEDVKRDLSRQSLQARPSSTLSRYATPSKDGRLSLAARTPLRVKSKDKGSETCDPGTGVRLSTCPPTRVQKKSETCDNEGLGDFAVPRLSLFGRPSLISQNTGSLFGRPSLVSQNPGPGLQGRPSLVSQTPGRNVQGRPSLAAHTPGRVLKPAAESCYPDMCEKEPRISMGPGRVFKPVSESSTADFPKDPRFSLAAQTPGRVIQPSASLASALHTPGRVPLNKPPVDGPIKTPNKELTDDYGTPSRVVKTPSKQVHTPLRVLQVLETLGKNSPKPTVIGTPVTPKWTRSGISAANMTPLRILKPDITQPEGSPSDAAQLLETPEKNSQRPDAISRHVKKWTGERTPDAPNTRQTTLEHCFTSQYQTPPNKMALKSDVSNGVISPVTRLFSRHGLVDRRESPKSSPGFTMDLRSMWKTKKSATRTPVKKEIMTSLVDGGVQKETRTSPRPFKLTVTSEKRKKVTWADKLKTCSLADQDFPDTKLEDKLVFLEDDNIDTDSKGFLFQSGEPQCSSDVIGSGSEDQNKDDSLKRNDYGDVELVVNVDHTQRSHYAMQEAPSQEQRATSPPQSTSPHTSHNSPVLSSQSASETMQLAVGAVCSPISSREGIAVDNRSWNQSGNEIPGPIELGDLTKWDNVIKQIPDDPVTWARLQECLKVKLKGNTGSGHEMDVTKGSVEDNTLEMSLNISNNNNVEAETIEYCQESRKGWSPELGERVAGNSEHVDNHSQGIYPAPHTRALDVNSNITLSATKTTQQNQLTQEMTMLQNHYTQAGPMSTSINSSLYTSEPAVSSPYSKRQLDCDENTTPFILRNQTDTVVSSGFSDFAVDSNDLHEHMVEEKENDAEHKIRTATLYFPTPMAAVRREVVNQSETGPAGLNLPIWTPLVLKAVAKQQKKGVDSVVRDLSFNTSVHAADQDTWTVRAERQVLSEMTDVQNTLTETHKPVKSVLSTAKESTVKATAFRPVGRPTKVMPSVGPLALRANLNTNLKHKKSSKKNSHLASLLQMEFERYQDAMVDDEVELYMCRLVKKRIVGYQRECCNPVAKILTEGDDMCFVPVEMEVERGEKMNKLESAFEKCMRST